MKRIILFLLAFTLVLPMAKVLASPEMTEGSFAVVYVDPQDDDTLLIRTKYKAKFAKDQVFPVSEGGTDIVVDAGAELKDGVVTFDNKTEEIAEVMYRYTIPADAGYQFKSVQDNTEFTVLFAVGKGTFTTEDVEMDRENEFFPIPNSGGDYYLSEVSGLKANQQLNFTYDSSGEGAQSEPEDSSPPGIDDISKKETYHTPGHLSMWNESPMGNWNAHITLSVLAFLIVLGTAWFIYFKINDRKKRSKIEDANQGEEEQFTDLVARRKVTLQKITELQDQLDNGEIDEDTFQRKEDAYQKYLVKISIQLRKFTD